MRCSPAQKPAAAGVGTTSLVKELLIVLLGGQLERDPYKGIELLALSELRSGFHGAPPGRRSHRGTEGRSSSSA
jgi:hypothetical protein